MQDNGINYESKREWRSMKRWKTESKLILTIEDRLTLLSCRCSSSEYIFSRPSTQHTMSNMTH